MFAALLTGFFANFSASADSKLHPADIMDSGQTGVEMVVGNTSLSYDYHSHGVSAKVETGVTGLLTTLRYGVTNSLEVNATLPYMQNSLEATSTYSFGSSNYSRKNSCFGDASFGAAFKPLSASSQGIDLVVKLDVQPQTQPHSTDGSTCGHGYTTKSVSLVISKTLGRLRPYIDLTMSSRSKEGNDSSEVELGAQWQVDPKFALTASYFSGKVDADSFFPAISQKIIGIDAAYAVQRNMWATIQVGHQSINDFQSSSGGNYTNMNGNIILLGLQILY